MRNSIIIPIFCLAFLSTAHAQDTTAVVTSVARMEKAIIEKDTMALKALMLEDVAFGHSNGLVQSRRDLIDALSGGDLTYNSIQQKSILVDLRGKTAVVKEFQTSTGKGKGGDFKMDLFVLQLWTREKNGWKLVMRQSSRQL
jgi:hypothetical protein